jgi:hypothetical protein
MLNLTGINVVYFILHIALAGIVTVIGWYGGILTMPLPEKEQK